MTKKLLFLGLLLLALSNVFAQSSDDKTAVTNHTSLAEEVSLYPNPASEKVQISNESGNALKVVIYNILGDPMITKNIKNNDNYIDVTNLRVGVYIVHFIDGKRTTTKRLVKI